MQATVVSRHLPWSCPIGCNGPVYITTSPTGADSGCSIATGVIVPREVVDSRGLASHSSVPCGSRSSIRCVSARSSIAASRLEYRSVASSPARRLVTEERERKHTSNCRTCILDASLLVPLIEFVQARVLVRIPAFFIILTLLYY